MPLRALLLPALLAPSLAGAQPSWDGTYRLSEDADCAKVGEEGGSLRIGDGVLEGVDATCKMTKPVDVHDLDATIYTMDCEGEGQSWTERALLMKAAQGDAIYLAWRGYVFRYDRCPEPDEATAEDQAPEDGAGGSDATADRPSGGESGAEEGSDGSSDGG